MKITIPTLSLLTAVLLGSASMAHAADVPAPRLVEASVCGGPVTHPCVTADGHPVRFWAGSMFRAGTEERYVGFVTLLPRPGDAANPYAGLMLMAVEFRQQGGAWQPTGPSAPAGRLRLVDTGQAPSPEPQAGVPVRDLPDGSLILAMPTVLPSKDGKQAHAFELLRRGKEGWVYGGFVPGAVDESKACQAQARRNDDDPRDCEAVSGNLLFDGSGPEGWPGIVVSFDLLGRRNGQPFTTTGWEQHRYAYDPATKRYVEVSF